LLPLPIAATYNYELVQHEDGVDAYDLGNITPIEAYISSSEFDIGDGHNFGYVWRIVPDLTFAGSSSTAGTEGSGVPAPAATMTLYPLESSGSGVDQVASGTITKSSTYNITERFTGIIYTRARGRQMIFKIASTQLGTTWQLGAPRLDIKADGRR
jgi:hypothetical protein